MTTHEQRAKIKKYYREQGEYGECTCELPYPLVENGSEFHYIDCEAVPIDGPA